QTVNRFYPALEIAAAIQTLGLDKAKLLPGLLKIARAGALRLTYLQNKDGLWGWWRKGASDPEMSAYALIALARARKAGVDFSKKTMERAKKALPGLQQRVRDPDARAFLLLAQSWAFGTDFQRLAPVFADRARLSTRGLAHLALAYEPMGRTSQQRILIDEMGRRRTPPDVETLGWALAAAAGLDPTSALSRDLALKLARHREGGGFGTTRQTGAAIVGLARALEGQGMAPRGTTLNVSINGETVLTEEIPAEGRSLSLPVEKLKPGENRLAVTGSGGGTLFFSLSLEAVRKEAPDTGGPLALQRSHALVPSRYSEQSAQLVKQGGVVREPEVDALRIGEIMRVTLALRSSGQRHLVIEDPLPAGFEPIAGSEKGPFAATHRLDDRMVFFLDAPTEKVALSYLVQSEAPGKVKAPPALAYAMYQPTVAAYSTEKALEIVGQLDLLNRDPTLGLDAFALWEQARSLAKEQRYELAARHIDALLDRYELLPGMRLKVSRELARIRAALEDPAGVVKCYEWLLAEDPTARLTLQDESLRAEAFRTLDRHGEAITAMEGATALLFGIEKRVPKETGDRSLAEKIFDRYPFAPYLESAWINYAQQRAGHYEGALARKEEADPKDLLALFEFLARYPQSAAAPQIAFRHMRAHLRAGRFDELESEARRFGDRWPGDIARDDADWFVVYALFAQDRFAEADAAAKASLSRTYAHPGSKRGPSGYRNNLIHLRAQAAQVQGRLDEAIALYRQVASVSPDAREALAQLTRRKITMPSVVRVGVGEKAAVPLTAQNLRGARLQLYPIDLLVYFTLKKDVDKVAGLNLDGLRPAQEKEAKFPTDRLEHTTEIDLGALAAGVYLVIVQSREKELRGIVVVSDIEAAAWLHPDGARVVVRHRKSGEPVVGAYVKVAVKGYLVGQGATDARGVFEVKGGFQGAVSAVAAKEGSYALASR
ncbi:MAG: tetratricopeptide repeat protein, partial [Planctomycetota bacterium]